MRYRKRSSGSSQLSNGISTSLNRLEPHLIGFILSIIDFILSVYALIARSFLRSKLGERTFNLLGIILIYSFSYAVLILPQLTSKALESSFSDIDNSLEYFTNLILILPSAPWLILTENQELPNLDSSVYIFLTIVFLVCIGHVLDVMIRRRKDEIVHSYHRGDSLFFGWLKGRRIGSYIINELTIWIAIEPLFVLFIAWFLKTFLLLDQVALILTVSAFCLFIEEYRVDMDNRKFILDIIDGQLEAGYARQIQSYYATKVKDLNLEETQVAYEASLKEGNPKGPFDTRRKKGQSKFKAKIT